MTGLRSLGCIFLLQVILWATAVAQDPCRTGPRAVLEVKNNGVYRVDYNLLASLGLNPDKLDPRNLALYTHPPGMLPQANALAQGLREVAIQVTGESDGRFDKDDYILFYAQGPDRLEYVTSKGLFLYQNNLYSDVNSYLLVAGTCSGKRVVKVPSPSGNSLLISEYADCAIFETDIYNDLKSGLESVYVFDQSSRPADNGTVGTSYTATVYVIGNDGTVNGPYGGSSYPNSVSLTDNSAAGNTLKEGSHSYNNLAGHSISSKKGLNIVNEDGARLAPGTSPDGADVTMTVVNVHEGKSNNGGPKSRGSMGCPTIKPADSEAFFSNFDWSGTVTTTKDGQPVTYVGTTGTSSGQVHVYRGETTESVLAKNQIAIQQSLSQLEPEVIEQ